MSSVEGTSSNSSLADYTKKAEPRKVSTGGVVNEGDTRAFSTPGGEMGKDQFLNLLVAQLRYQDPLKPAEDTQFITQLAQFSQLEFTQNSTAAISTLASNMQAFMDMQNMQAQSITNASATPLLGKEVRVMEASFKYGGLGGKDLNIFLAEGHKNGVAVIKNSEGKVVAEIEVSVDSIKGGETTIKWNGKDSNDGKDGQTICLGGTYTVEVMDVNQAKSVGYAYQDGMVSGVSFHSGGASLTINGTQFGLGYLVNVQEVASRIMESSFKYSGSDGKEFNIFLSEGNKEGLAVIKDSNGNIVAELDVSADSNKGGDAKVKWDGKKDGIIVSEGTYTIEVMDVSGSKSVGYAYRTVA
ncbi:MAG: hypothetical protein FWC15_00435 [Fibromonadales bacterium]|nr:hypothetical protein [Fibromonadales bacterium]